MRVKLTFEGTEVTFFAIPEDEFEEKLLLALINKGMLEGKVEHVISDKKLNEFPLVLRPKKKN